MCATGVWNNFHHLCSNLKDWKAKLKSELSIIEISTTCRMNVGNKSSFNLSNVNISEKVQADVISNDTVELTLPVIFVGLMTLLGVSGNLLVIIIFGRKKKKRTYTIFILSLAFADFMVCSVTLPFEIYEIRNTFTFYSVYGCKIFRTYNYLFVFWSTVILILLSIDRYRRVCQPIKVQFSQKFAFLLIFSGFLLSVCLAWPNVFLQGIQRNQNGDHIIYQCSVAEEYATKSYTLVYAKMILVVSIANIVTIIVLYVFIGRKVIQHMRYRKRFRYASTNTKNLEQNNSHGLELHQFPAADQPSFTSSIGQQSIKSVQRELQSSLKITKIALTIGVVFVISYVPSVVLSLVEAQLGKRYMENYSSTSIGFLLIAERAFIINHVVNPFIYGFHDSSFRKTCKELVSDVLIMLRCTRS